MSNLTSREINALKRIIEKVEDKPKKKRSKGNLPRPFSMRQVNHFFKVCHNTKMSLMCFLSLRTGMRKSEVISLKISEIDFENNQIRKLTGTKNNKPAIFILDKRVMKILKKWISLLPKTDWLFPSSKGIDKPITKAGLYGEYKKTLIRSGLWEVDKLASNGYKFHKYTFHNWRDTYCSLLVNNGVDIWTATRLMRHSNPRTTAKHYAYIGDVNMRNTLNKVFSKNGNKHFKKIIKEFPEIKTKEVKFEGHIEENALELLKRKLVLGEIKLEEFNEKAKAILELGKTQELDTMHKTYIG